MFVNESKIEINIFYNIPLASSTDISAENEAIGLNPQVCMTLTISTRNVLTGPNTQPMPNPTDTAQRSSSNGSTRKFKTAFWNQLCHILPNFSPQLELMTAHEAKVLWNDF